MTAPAPSNDSYRLTAVKTVHTIVWVFFVASILAVPLTAWAGRFDLCLGAAGIVFVEVVVLLVNRWSCPLTAIAARYTSDRRANFDIYLPEWLARHNKEIFGVLFIAGLIFAVWEWRRIHP